MKFKDTDVLLRNNTGNKSKDSLIEGFVIRTKEFENLFSNIRKSKKQHNQHFLIIGQRGAGKTTLLHRLNYAIEDDSELSAVTIPIIFSEEQYHLSELTNLWESIAGYLEDNYQWQNISAGIDKIIANNNDYELLAFEYLKERLKLQNKTLIVIIENINVFLKKIDKTERERLKAILLSADYIKIIGSSTSFNDGIIDFSSEFFDFFQVIQLNGLNKSECENLLIKIGQQYGAEEQIKDIIKNNPARIEALRRLTGGVPRTIAYLFEIFLNNKNGKAITDLYILIDTLTFLYKSELDQLSSQQQKVIDVIARKWDAIGVKEISKITRFESKNISSILSGLEKNQLIEKVQTSTKNHLYRIKERFMNIWYLMRFGRKHDKENVIWLVRFFDAWCEEKELNKLITDHIDNLKEGLYDVNAAIDMGNTFLSCENVSESLKLELIRMTKSVLPKRLLDKVRISSKNVHNTLVELITAQNFDEALKMLNEIDVKDLQYYTLASSLYLMTADYEKSAESAKKVLEFDNKNAGAALTLGIIYEDFLNDIETAITYYKLSLSQKPFHPYAASRLGDITFKYNDNPDEAIKLHKKAVIKAFWPSLISLGKIHIYQNKLSDAESYLKRAVFFKVENAYSELAKLYMISSDSAKVVRALENAIKNNEDNALIKAGLYYQNRKRPNFEKAKSYFKHAIEEGIIEGYSRLGKLHQKYLNDLKQGLEIYTRGVMKGDAESAHQLAHAYARKGMFKESDDLFMQAYHSGKPMALLCLISEIYLSGRVERKGYALKLLSDNFKNLSKEFHADLLYAKVLLWNDRIDESLTMVKNMYKEIAQIKNDVENDRNEDKANHLLNQLFQYFLLLIAKEKFKIALDLFEDSNVVDLKILLKPIYFVLMENMKTEFPVEYLKAGDEFKDTIGELKNTIERLKQMI